MNKSFLTASVVSVFTGFTKSSLFPVSFFTD